MLRFYGFDLELTVDSIVQRGSDQPVVRAATDVQSRRWLIVESERPRTWVCAPASDRAVQLVESGHAAASDAVLHSATGWVEVVKVVDGHSVPDDRVSCAEVAASGLLSLSRG